MAAGAQGLKLKKQPTLMLLPPAPEEDLPIFIEAQRIEGHADREAQASGYPLLHKPLDAEQLLAAIQAATAHCS